MGCGGSQGANGNCMTDVRWKWLMEEKVKWFPFNFNRQSGDSMHHLVIVIEDVER